MSRCIVNVAVGRWFPRGQDRLRASLQEFTKERFISWRDAYPPGASSHADAPYAFKAFAVAAARVQGFTSILWLDASMWAVRSLEPLWSEIELRGSVFLRSGHGLGQYASDAALAQLGVTRDELLEKTWEGPSASRGEPWQHLMVAGGIYGIDLRHADAQEFQRRMFSYAVDQRIFRGAWDNARGQCSPDPRCLGHRHDMVPMAHLVQSLGLHVINPPRFYALPTPEFPAETGGHPDAVILARGM